MKRLIMIVDDAVHTFDVEQLIDVQWNVWRAPKKDVTGVESNHISAALQIDGLPPTTTPYAEWTKP